MNWIDKEVAFYDFIWAYGVNAHTDCINRELFEDFAAGGDKFEEMKKLILEKFPTKEIALREFENESGTSVEDRCGREPEKVKPLAQYLVNYIEHEIEIGNINLEYDLWHELLEQALDAYQSTENVKIRIEKV
ncbi:hypothetical protein KAR91_57675 [Candidatus Pacearchaeota archaeon]|nr:hypothetical protein [Candidatus Pacearchaeota archaeon]